MNELRHLDLFSGIGGFALSAESAGFRTIAFVEREPFCQKILAQHWPRVPVYSDICQFSGRSLRPISLLTGGFPCQPFSLAGERRGKADDRFIWPEMLRVIQATEPDWIIGENVAGLDGLGLDDCISDLEASGYEVAPPLEIPACAVDARHIRNRIWILANSHSFISRASRASSVESSAATSIASASEQSGAVADAMREQTERKHSGGFLNEPAGSGEDVANAASSERDRGGDSWRRGDRPTDGSEVLDNPDRAQREGDERTIGIRPEHADISGPSGWPTEPDVGRVANGIPNRTHRLKGLGNAIVPQVAYQIIKAIHTEIIKTEKR